MNPFANYLPCYAPGTVPDRPWWRLVPTGQTAHAAWSAFTRCDGQAIVAEPYKAPVYWGSPDPEWRAERERERRAYVAAHLANMDAYDLAHPLLVPPPMATQVWVLADGEQDSVGRVFPNGDVIFANGPYVRAAEWPPPGAVLVLGPTPWGRDCPWAPAGWRP